MNRRGFLKGLAAILATVAAPFKAKAALPSATMFIPQSAIPTGDFGPSVDWVWYPGWNHGTLTFDSPFNRHGDLAVEGANDDGKHLPRYGGSEEGFEERAACGHGPPEDHQG